MRGVALLAGVVVLVGLGIALAARGNSETAPTISTSEETTPATSAQASAGTSTETSTEPAPTEEPPAAGTVTIAAVGDIAMGRDGFLPAGGPESLFAGVSGLLRGDVVLGNLEQALTRAGTSKCGAGSTDCFAFRTPPSYAKGLAGAGFTVLSVANNHAYDYGSVGQADTIRALERAGLAYTGLIGKITRLQEEPVRVAVLGFGFYSTAESLLDITRAAGLVERADRWADIVLVTFHGGAEGSGASHVPRGMEVFLGEQRGDLRAFSHAAVDAGADLVVGHGPHVLRGMEWYKRRLIAYSLGNFVGHHTFSTDGGGGVSGVLRVALRGDGSWVKGKLAPTALVGAGAAVRDPAERAHGLVRELSQQDFGGRAIRVSPAGELMPRA
jgi:Bacterial capsule synthesis protein PGA_cap